MRRRALALLVGLAALALLASAGAAATVAPNQLTVGVNLPSEGFQVGIADGTKVIYARGFEIDLARALAGRLSLSGGAVFTQSPFSDLVAPGPKPWDVALAEVTVTGARRQNVDFSVPYLRADQGVLTSQFLRTLPRSIAALRKLHLCAQQGTTGVDTIKNRIKPRTAGLYPADVPTLMLYVQLGRCDAVVYDLPALATLKDHAPRRYGELAGLIRTGEQYAVVLPKGSALRAPVDQAISALRGDGTLTRLQRTWLSVDTSAVRVLR
jgi:polar amino acid transport system substrate-binding protein